MDLDPIDLSKLDPGIRNFVAFLRSKGFNTTDSGDGKSKPLDEETLPWPHVFITCAPEALQEVAQRLASAMTSAGLTVEPGDIQGTYDPAQPTTAVIALVDDEERYMTQFTWAS